MANGQWFVRRIWLLLNETIDSVVVIFLFHLPSTQSAIAYTSDTAQSHSDKTRTYVSRPVCYCCNPFVVVAAAAAVVVVSFAPIVAPVVRHSYFVSRILDIIPERPPTNRIMTSHPAHHQSRHRMDHLPLEKTRLWVLAGVECGVAAGPW